MRPTKTFSIFLYSVPDHCEMVEIPLGKWCTLGCFGMAWKQASVSGLVTSFMHQLHKWSLKTPLYNWCRMSGVSQLKMSVWEAFQKWSHDRVDPHCFQARNIVHPMFVKVCDVTIRMSA